MPYFTIETREAPEVRDGECPPGTWRFDERGGGLRSVARTALLVVRELLAVDATGVRAVLLHRSVRGGGRGRRLAGRANEPLRAGLRVGRAVPIDTLLRLGLHLGGEGRVLDLRSVERLGGLVPLSRVASVAQGLTHGCGDGPADHGRREVERDQTRDGVREPGPDRPAGHFRVRLLPGGGPDVVHRRARQLHDLGEQGDDSVDRQGGDGDHRLRDGVRHDREEHERRRDEGHVGGHEAPPREPTDALPSGLDRPELRCEGRGLRLGERGEDVGLTQAVRDLPGHRATEGHRVERVEQPVQEPDRVVVHREQRAPDEDDAGGEDARDRVRRELGGVDPFADQQGEDRERVREERHDSDQHDREDQGLERQDRRADHDQEPDHDPHDRSEEARGVPPGREVSDVLLQRREGDPGVQRVEGVLPPGARVLREQQADDRACVLGGVLQDVVDGEVVRQVSDETGAVVLEGVPQGTHLTERDAVSGLFERVERGRRGRAATLADPAGGRSAHEELPEAAPRARTVGHLDLDLSPLLDGERPHDARGQHSSEDEAQEGRDGSRPLVHHHLVGGDVGRVHGGHVVRVRVELLVLEEQVHESGEVPGLLGRAVGEHAADLGRCGLDDLLDGDLPTGGRLGEAERAQGPHLVHAEDAHRRAADLLVVVRGAARHVDPVDHVEHVAAGGELHGLLQLALLLAGVPALVEARLQVGLGQVLVGEDHVGRLHEPAQEASERDPDRERDRAVVRDELGDEGSHDGPHAGLGVRQHPGGEGARLAAERDLTDLVGVVLQGPCDGLLDLLICGLDAHAGVVDVEQAVPVHGTSSRQ